MNNRKKTTLTLSVSHGERELLEKLAIKFDCKWGEDKPNVSELISRIAKGEITLVESEPEASKDLSEIYEGISKINQGLANISKGLSELK